MNNNSEPVTNAATLEINNTSRSLGSMQTVVQIYDMDKFDGRECNKKKTLNL